MAAPAPLDCPGTLPAGAGQQSFLISQNLLIWCLSLDSITLGDDGLISKLNLFQFAN